MGSSRAGINYAAQNPRVVNSCIINLGNFSQRTQRAGVYPGLISRSTHANLFLLLLASHLHFTNFFFKDKLFTITGGINRTNVSLEIIFFVRAVLITINVDWNGTDIRQVSRQEVPDYPSSNEMRFKILVAGHCLYKNRNPR